MILNEVMLKLGIAVVLVMLGILIARILGRLVQKILHEMNVDKRLKKTGYGFKIEKNARKFVNYTICLIAIIYALDQLGLTKEVLWFLFAIIFITAIILAYISIKELIKDFRAGVKIHKNIQIGNNLKIGNVEGRIVNISRTNVQIKTNENELVFVPYSYMKSRKND